MKGIERGRSLLSLSNVKSTQEQNGFELECPDWPRALYYQHHHRQTLSKGTVCTLFNRRTGQLTRTKGRTAFDQEKTVVKKEKMTIVFNWIEQIVKIIIYWTRLGLMILALPKRTKEKKQKKSRIFLTLYPKSIIAHAMGVFFFPCSSLFILLCSSLFFFGLLHFHGCSPVNCR